MTYEKNVQKKTCSIVLAVLVALAVLCNAFAGTCIIALGADDTDSVSYTFTISGTSVQFYDNRGNVFKTEPLTFNVTIPTTKDNIPMLQYSGNHWSAQGWNGNSSSFQKDNSYGYTSTLTSDYLGVRVLELDKRTTTIPLYDFTTNKAYWLGEEYSTMEELQEAFFANIEDQQKEVMMMQYNAPEIVKVALIPPSASIGAKFGEVASYQFAYRMEDGVTDLLGTCTVNGVDLEGNKKTFTFNILPYELGSHRNVYWTDDTIHKEYHVEFECEVFKLDLKKEGVSNFQIDDITMELQYKYVDGNLSRIAKHTYYTETNSVVGSTYNPETGDYEQQLDVDMSDWTGNPNHNQFVTDTKMTLQEIVDWFSQSLSLVISSISQVFAMVTNLISSSMSFVRYLGSILEVLFGSTLGSIMSLALLSAIVLRLLKR